MRQEQLVERAARQGGDQAVVQRLDRGRARLAVECRKLADMRCLLDHGVGDLSPGGGVVDHAHPAGDHEQHVAVVGSAIQHQLAAA